MATRKEIFVGLGTTHPPVDEYGRTTCGQWEHEKVYVVPLIDGISDNLWKRIYNETNEYRPMYGHDGSAVYLDDDNWQIVRKIGKQIIKIANVTAVC
jgi:hypothetical protein